MTVPTLATSIAKAFAITTIASSCSVIILYAFTPNFDLLLPILTSFYVPMVFVPAALATMAVRYLVSPHWLFVTLYLTGALLWLMALPLIMLTLGCPNNVPCI